MTVAQHKINQYCIDNNISRCKLSEKLGYSTNYIHYMLHGQIPDPDELQVIEPYFGINKGCPDIKDIIVRRYGDISTGHIFFKRETGLYACYSSFWRWCNGIMPRNRKMFRAFCDFVGVSNEWIDDYSTV